MKQKVVIRVSMGDHKKGRSKAMKIVVSVSGVESAALQGPEKDEIQVIGEGIDAVELTTLLRKNVGPSEIVSVGPAEQKKEEEKKDANANANANKNEVTMISPLPLYYTSYPVYDVVPDHEPSCSIM